jgi:hypothetical protein
MPGRGGGPGWTVPGYSHVRELGAGASGVVMLAVDDITQTQVAVKYLRRGDAALLRRLRAETEAWSRLEDPNVVLLYEYAESPQGAALVTEFVDGVSLRRLLAVEGGVRPEAALSVLSGSLLALAALHDDARLLHRAFKPENILIAGDGTTKITDIGLGEAPGYQGPERDIGPATDIYAATKVFVECLTGPQAVPEPFRGLVMAGLAANPAGRPASAAGFLADLDEIAATAYGETWERTGRSRLADHVARVPYVPGEWAAPAEPKSPAARESAGRQPAQEPAADAARPKRQPEPKPPEPKTVQPQPAKPQPAKPNAAEPNAAEPNMGEPRRAEPHAGEPQAGEPKVEEPPAERSPFGMSPFGPSPYGLPEYETESTGHGEPRRPRQWPARGRTALGVGIVAAVAIAATWYVVAGRNSQDPLASAQTTPPRPTSERPHPSAGPADLAQSISKAVATRRSATFTYRAAGVAAQGALRFTANAATAYDMRVTPLTGARVDRRHPATRVILFGNNAYVARGGWKSYPIAEGGRPGDPGRLYATLAADTRWSSSVHNILALLRSTTQIKRTDLTYRGVASLARLRREPMVAELYKQAPRGSAVRFTIEMAQNQLPRQLIVTIKSPGSRRTFRTTYTGWAQNAPITPPR